MMDSVEILQFKIPDSPQRHMAIFALQVLELTELPETTPIPFTPYWYSGLSWWRDQSINVLNLGAMLFNQVMNVDEMWHYVIAQCVVKNNTDLIAFPIVGGAKFVRLNALVENSGVSTPLVYDTIFVDNLPVQLINLNGIQNHMQSSGIA